MQKAQIKINDYIVPIPHPSIYPYKIPLAHEKNIHLRLLQICISTHQPTKNVFQTHGSTIKYNECDHVITQHHKQDAKALALAETILNHHSLSVIMRENKHTLILLNNFMQHIFHQ